MKTLTENEARICLHAIKHNYANAKSIIKGQLEWVTDEDFKQIQSNYLFNEFSDVLTKAKKRKNYTTERKELKKNRVLH